MDSAQIKWLLGKALLSFCQAFFKKRPFSSSQIAQISIDIEDLAIKKGRENREISTNDLGEIVLEKLYALDKVAYIRFASVYKKFESLEQFINEIKYCEKEGN